MVSLVTGVIGVSISVLIIVLIRKDRLHAHHGLGWILVALSFALIGLFPGIIDRLAQIVGIGYPPVLALTLGISLLVIKILLMDIERSKIEMRNQRLIQRVAMLEADLKKLKSPGGAGLSERGLDS
jgi:hypothetical protein